MLVPLVTAAIMVAGSLGAARAEGAAASPTPTEVFQLNKKDGKTILGPATPQDQPAWLAALKRWRDARKIALKYNGALYDRPELAWTQRSFIQPQMMVEERYFYDPVTRKYTVDRYLDDLDKRYGGIDSVLIWPVYPNVGIDNRNQHDLLRDLPGGLAGVKGMIDDFHRRGVHVLFPMMPWEAGTRIEGLSLKDSVAHEFALAGIDGANGDTMWGLPKEFLAAADAEHHPLAFEPECGIGGLGNIQWNCLTWGYWYHPPIPTVDLCKWIEPRHLTNICERWSHDHTNALQAAFFNGDGFESWENVWGIWNGMTPRDAEALRRVATVERGVADFLISPDWEPHAATLLAGVYASKFPLDNRAVWLLVNRTQYNMSGAQLTIPHVAGERYYDIWNGRSLTAQIAGNSATLSFPIEANGFGAVLATTGSDSANLTKLLGRMAELARTPLADFSKQWKPLPQQLVSIPATAPAKDPPTGMVLIPEGNFPFRVHGVEIEASTGVDVQYPWEITPGKKHDHVIAVKPFCIDKYPVTNEQFKKFLAATGYHPADDHNFLKDWSGGAYPEGWGNKPVTWISLEDARAYAAWAGKRLPHEWEWQYAAQGTDGRPYPWGVSPDPQAIPPLDTGHDLRAPTDVDAFPKGASPFGVMDMVGNVWQWTDEFQDDHTRAGIVRGGSYYQPGGSQWYFPPNPTLDEHGKYLLMCPGKDRAGTVGFRCVCDR